MTVDYLVIQSRDNHKQKWIICWDFYVCLNKVQCNYGHYWWCTICILYIIHIPHHHMYPMQQTNKENVNRANCCHFLSKSICTWNGLNKTWCATETATALAVIVATDTVTKTRYLTVSYLLNWRPFVQIDEEEKRKKKQGRVVVCYHIYSFTVTKMVTSITIDCWN